MQAREEDLNLADTESSPGSSVEYSQQQVCESRTGSGSIQRSPLRPAPAHPISNWFGGLLSLVVQASGPSPQTQLRPDQRPTCRLMLTLATKRAGLEVAAPGHAPFRNPQRNACQWRAPAANRPQLAKTACWSTGRAPVARCCFFLQPAFGPLLFFPTGVPPPSLPLSCFSLPSCLAYLGVRFSS